MLTYQDYEEYTGTQAEFLKQAINEYIASDFYKTAEIADKYDRQQNVTINQASKMLFTLNREKIEDCTSSNNQIPCNIFHRLITQRCMYSLGNGISFLKEGIKEKFGKKVDDVARAVGLSSLSGGVGYFYLADRLYKFDATEIVPLYDEYTGNIRAAIRHWKLNENKPMQITFFEKDGYTQYVDDKKDGMKIIKEKRPYILKTVHTKAFGTEIVGFDNYPEVPIVPMWGSRLKQSALVGMRSAIDAIDLVQSGFANNLSDCAEIYWLLQNAGGMTPNDMQKFRDRLLFNHIAATNSDEATITPYTQEIPHEARDKFLEYMRSQIYEGFGGLDVHTIAAGATNDHIAAAYQPVDEEADDFEYQIIEAFEKLGALLGLDPNDCIPQFNRNKQYNQAEFVDMVMQMSMYLDDETILSKAPFITEDERKEILKRKAAEEQAKVVDLRAKLDELRTETGETEGLTDGQSA